MWLSGLSTGLQTKESPVQYPSEHMPELQARCPVGGAPEATTHYCFSPSLSPSPPLSKIHKEIKSLKRYFSKKKESKTGKSRKGRTKVAESRLVVAWGQREEDANTGTGKPLQGCVHLLRLLKCRLKMSECLST